jgi:glutathione synthase/RimK-type ligase-like ATP-grasp enzyme
MRNKSSDDFRTNLCLGNKITEDYEITSEQKKLALDVAKASGLVWCGVDLMPLKNGKTLVVEYNGAPGPMTDYSADPETLCKMNEEFYAKFLETINKMC